MKHLRLVGWQPTAVLEHLKPTAVLEHTVETFEACRLAAYSSRLAAYSSTRAHLEHLKGA